MASKKLKIFPKLAIHEAPEKPSVAKADVKNPSGLTVADYAIDRRGSDDDRYFTASSGEDGDEEYDADNDNEDYDDDMCIMLDSDNDDGDDGSLSGLHINLKTLQAVSNMLAHYTPIIQQDVNGNPLFVAPPPPTVSPPDLPTTSQMTPTSGPRDSPAHSTDDTIDEEQHDFEMALQELENVISAEDDSFFVDKMSELTEVMEKMTQHTEVEELSKTEIPCNSKQK